MNGENDMLQEDGVFELYQVQFKKSDNLWLSESWNLDDSSFKECWQRLGIDGSFNFSSAKKLMTELAQSHPHLEFRIIKLFLSQKTFVVSTARQNNQEDYNEMPIKSEPEDITCCSPLANAWRTALQQGSDGDRINALKQIGILNETGELTALGNKIISVKIV